MMFYVDYTFGLVFILYYLLFLLMTYMNVLASYGRGDLLSE